MERHRGSRRLGHQVVDRADLGYADRQCRYLHLKVSVKDGASVKGTLKGVLAG